MDVNAMAALARDAYAYASAVFEMVDVGVFVDVVCVVSDVNGVVGDGVMVVDVDVLKEVMSVVTEAERAAKIASGEIAAS